MFKLRIRQDTQMKMKLKLKTKIKTKNEKLILKCFNYKTYYEKDFKIKN